VLDNYAIPSGMLSSKEMLTPQQVADLRAELAKEYTGKSRFSPMVLAGGLTWQQVTLTHADLQWMEQHSKNKQEICAVLQVPEPLVGAVNDPAHTIYGQARQSFWEDRVIPTLKRIGVKINKEITPLYGDDIEVRPDISEVPAFRFIMEDKANAAQKFWGMGVPFNDVNARLGIGFDTLASGDVGWLPMNMQPIDGPTLPAPPATPGKFPPGTEKPKPGNAKPAGRQLKPNLVSNPNQPKPKLFEIDSLVTKLETPIVLRKNL
jgi:hypothetical protein